MDVKIRSDSEFEKKLNSIAKRVFSEIDMLARRLLKVRLDRDQVVYSTRKSLGKDALAGLPPRTNLVALSGLPQ